MTSKLPRSGELWPRRPSPLAQLIITFLPSFIVASLPHRPLSPLLLLCPLTSLRSKCTSSLSALFALLSFLASMHVALSQESQNYLTTAPSSNLSGGDGVIVGGVRRAEDVLPRPENVSVILVNWYPPAVRVQWMYNGTSRKEHTHLMAFQIIYHPVNSRYRIIQEVPPYFRNLTLDRLQPGTEYALQINSLFDYERDISNKSRLVNFVSPDNEARRSRGKFINRPIHTYPDEIQEGLRVREDEVVIVVLVIIAWLGCIFVFFNKWGKIRMLEPYQPQYQKESFHNSIHSIHPKPSRMNTCTSVPPNMISIESRGSLICADREMLFHHNRMTESGQLYQCASGTTYHHPAYRPRLNSFVGGPYHRDSLYPEPNLPRKVKSAEDLKSLVVQVNNYPTIPSTSTSVL